ncbi:MAG TPA: GNAT family N-acetyltransferase [Hyphomonadaceae bacterium]|jgi:GNAT superfamily N-acetyltransferase|nr:GNAT family N-acetyltransferase [Hyphomonadaceae bacterium]
MPDEAAPAPKLTFKPVTKATWPDLEALFEARGGPSYCWCMPFRPLDVKNRTASSKADRKRGLKAMVQKRTPVGLVGYLEGEPVAWCSVGPRDSFIDKLTDKYDPEEKGVWSVTCFFVRRDHRGEALTQQMLDAALAYAKKRGAKVLEGYPVPATSPSYRFMGFLPLFRGRKFKAAGKAGSRRHVMRRPV